jgi:hypothetical protein
MKTLRYFIPLLFVVLIFSSSCKSQSTVTTVSDAIYKVQKSEFDDNMFIKALNLYRKQSNWLDKLEYSNKGDTIFILELPGVQGNYNFTFWNKKDTISYTNETGSFEFTNNPLFIKRMMRLVSDWDIEGIKEEENINSNLLPNETIYATRIIFLNKKYKIDSIRFKDFFNLERDSSD